MKIALIGYGKMGKTIHQVADEKNARTGRKDLDISLIIDIDNRNTITKEQLKTTELTNQNNYL